MQPLLTANLRFIQSRCCRLTYGISHSSKWTSENPDASAKFLSRSKNEWYARNHFWSVAKRGESVLVDERRTTDWWPIEDDQESMTIEIHATDDVEVKYMNSSMKKLGEVQVSIPGSGCNRKVEASFFFGSSEVTVTAREVQTGQECSTSVEFFSM